LDFTYVSDTAEGFVRAAIEPGGKNEVFNITYGEGRTLLEFAEILKTMVSELQIVIEPPEVHSPKRGALDSSKAEQLLGYKPKYRLEEGLKEYVEFVRQYGGM
jgi:nucleoside-diphosphate-sugar epimerase